MLLITKKYKIDGINDDFNINVIVPDCAVVISKEYDEITEILTVVLQYCDSDCLANYNTIKVVLTYNDGFCFFDKTFIITDNCANFNFTEGGIKLVDGCDTLCGVKFQAKVNDIHVDYIWEYDTLLFTRVTNSDNSLLVLKPTDKNRTFNNITTPIKVKIVSSEGCILQDELQYLICNLILDDAAVDLYCAEHSNISTYKSNFITLPFTACKDRVFDVNKILNLGEFIPFGDTEYSYKFQKDATGKLQVVLLYSEVTISTDLQLPLKIQLCSNETVTYLITVRLHTCTGPNYTLGFTHNFDCKKCINKFTQLKGLIPSNNSTCPSPSVDLNDYVFSNSPILWETFTFIPISPPQTLLNAYQLTTPYANVNFSPLTQRVIYVSTGGLTTVDLILFSVENSEGVVIEGELKFKKPGCDSDIIEIDDSTICLKIGETVNNIVLAPTGSTITVVQFPVYNIVSIKGNKATITTNSSVGQTDTFIYTASNESGESEETTLTIISYNPTIKSTSACLNSIGKYGINLNQFDTDTLALNGWVFAGYSPNVAVVPGNNIGVFSIENGQVNNYEVNQVLSLNANLFIEFSISGIYSFKNKSIDNCSTDLLVNIEIINPIGLQNKITKNLCKTVGVVNLNNVVTNLPVGGTWNTLGTVISGTFDSSNNTINTGLELTNTPLLFTYTLVNTGLYNEIACNSQLLLEIIIDDVPVEILPKCAIFCSLGPDPIIEPNCQNIEVDVDVPITGCDLDFFSTYALPENSSIKLVESPLNPIILEINGVKNTYRVGDYLPTVNSLIWAYYKAPLGHYKFEIVYGNSCQRVTTLDITLVKGGCRSTDINIVRCVETGTLLNLFTETSTAACQINFIDQTTGTNTTSFNSSTGEFSLDAPGYWEFDITSSIDSDAGSCEVCANTSKLIITINPLPGPGQAVPGTICNLTCPVNVFPLFFNPNLSLLGIFTYNGFSTTYRPLRPICSPIWSITDGPLSNQNLIKLDDDGNNVTVAPNTNITGAIQFSTVAPLGYYYFSNTVVDANGCECTSQTVVQLVEPLVAGTGTNTIICDNDPQILNLRTMLIGEDSGGIWSLEFTPTVPGQNYTLALNQNDPGFWISFDNATFNSTNQPTGQYIFKYTHTNPPSTFPYYAACIDCGVGQAQIQIDVINSSVAGIGNSPSTCQ